MRDRHAFDAISAADTRESARTLLFSASILIPLKNELRARGGKMSVNNFNLRLAQEASVAARKLGQRGEEDEGPAAYGTSKDILIVGNLLSPRGRFARSL